MHPLTGRLRPRKRVGQSRAAGPPVVRMASWLDLVAARAWRRCSARLRIDDLPYVDIAGAEARFAVGKIVLPHAAKTLVEAQMNGFGPGGKKANPPFGQGDGIVEPEYALVAQRQANPLSQGPHDPRRGEHAAREDVPANEIHLTAIRFEKTVLDRNDLQARNAAVGEALRYLLEVDRPILLADRFKHLDRGDAVVGAGLVAVVLQLDVDPFGQALLENPL